MAIKQMLPYVMHKGRLEAFSDGVIAILITIMVLELKTPEGTEWRALRPMVPTLLSYVMSYVFLGIYWNNHHHLIQTCQSVNGKILWANLQLLFWLSLVPFVTSWIGDSHFAPMPTAMYGFVLIMAAFAYTILQTCIIQHQGSDSKLAAALGNDAKAKFSLMLYAIGIPLALFQHSWIAGCLYALVELLWLVPDPRIERRLSH